MEEYLEGISPGHEQFCQIYLADVIVASKTFEQHLDHRRITGAFQSDRNKAFSKQVSSFHG